MSRVTLMDRRTSEELKQGLGIESVDRVVSRGRLRWYGYLERKNADDCHCFRSAFTCNAGLGFFCQIILLSVTLSVRSRGWKHTQVNNNNECKPPRHLAVNCGKMFSRCSF